ncbi:MAG: ImmA/IrrE family metallo-endopeptidase [Acetobacter okinawensis]
MLPKINVALGLTPFDIVDKFKNSAPVDLFGMARALKIGVDPAATFKDPNTSGSIRLLRDGSYLISINKDHSPNRKRFTLAHEISHFLLHRDIIDQRGLVDDAMYRSGASRNEEYQANRLAAELLMPEGLVRSFCKAGMTNPSIIARVFGASDEAAKIRLSQLGY